MQVNRNSNLSIIPIPTINTNAEQIQLSDINGDEYEEYHNQGNPEDALYQDLKQSRPDDDTYDEIPASLTDGSNENGDEGAYEDVIMWFIITNSVIYLIISYNYYYESVK